MTQLAEQARQPELWCRSCGTGHTPASACPGEVLATGRERHGFRVLVDTARGPQVLGTLVAPAGMFWRARILTFPNVLWVVPGGATMKFVGRTPAEAEGAAIDYIRKHCRQRGLIMRTEVPAVEGACVAPERAESAGPAAEPAARGLHALSVRYGVERPEIDTTTDDLSEGGLFLRAERPLPTGTELRLYVEVTGFGIPMRGVVRWTRGSGEPGRPAGMGVQLVHPHARFVQYVRERFPAAAASPAPIYDAGAGVAAGEAGDAGA